ncbi:MAG: iron-sulfur cluster assembly accessory protein [Anaerolineales bacterium]|nr:MAG: iron-sulfur cluster assembly accessory protein [Anaerolineales bacterium]
MINFTEAAIHKIDDLLAAEDHQGMYLRVQIMGRGAGGFRYSMRFIPADQASETDEIIALDSFNAIVDQESLENLKGATVDFKEDSFQNGFAIDNPNPVWKDSVAQAVQELLDSKINPGLASHGGFVALLDYKEDVAYIGFGGGCQGCGMVDMTLKNGVEAMILEAIPQVKQIVDTTDHQSGEKPYYESREGATSALA